MDDNLDYETYLLISSNKIVISVHSLRNEKIFEQELLFNQTSLEDILGTLDHFLNENIFMIEKKIDSFIKKVNIIFDLDIFFPVEVSIKMKNYEDIVDDSKINHILYDAKDSCKKTFNDL